MRKLFTLSFMLLSLNLFAQEAAGYIMGCVITVKKDTPYVWSKI